MIIFKKGIMKKLFNIAGIVLFVVPVLGQHPSGESVKQAAALPLSKFTDVDGLNFH